jgi:hypothetical protein
LTGVINHYDGSGLFLGETNVTNATNATNASETEGFYFTAWDVVSEYIPRGGGAMCYIQDDGSVSTLTYGAAYPRTNLSAGGQEGCEGRDIDEHFITRFSPKVGKSYSRSKAAIGTEPQNFKWIVTNATRGAPNVDQTFLLAPLPQCSEEDICYRRRNHQKRQKRYKIHRTNSKGRCITRCVNEKRVSYKQSLGWSCSKCGTKEETNGSNSTKQTADGIFF